MEISFRQKVGLHIRDLRTSQGLTQKMLAEMAGIRRQHLVSIEKGEYDLKLSTLEKVAGALDVAVSELVDV